MKNKIDELKKYFLFELEKIDTLEQIKKLNDSLLGKK